jgi:enolase-phosphatase E1
MLGSRLHSSAECRELEQVLSIDEASVGLLLLDIEGTTTPIDFVHGVLFPFASQRLDSFLGQNFHDPETRPMIEVLKAQQKEDLQQGLDPPQHSGGSEESEIHSVVAYARWLISRDSKCGALKALQGKIWQEGYESGELRGRVYSDVPRAFERWRGQERRTCVYSSGSVLAQQLLFRTTAFGDLTAFIEAFFDTKFGSKTETESYKRIAASLGCREGAALFLSDATKELDAARAAGMQTALCVRAEGDEPFPLDHPLVRTFDEVFP